MLGEERVHVSREAAVMLEQEAVGRVRVDGETGVRKKSCQGTGSGAGSSGRCLRWRRTPGGRSRRLAAAASGWGYPTRRRRRTVLTGLPRRGFVVVGYPPEDGPGGLLA